jgi:hypothetical protein
MSAIFIAGAIHLNSIYIFNLRYLVINKCDHCMFLTNI